MGGFPTRSSASCSPTTESAPGFAHETGPRESRQARAAGGDPPPAAGAPHLHPAGAGGASRRAGHRGDAGHALAGPGGARRAARFPARRRGVRAGAGQRDRHSPARRAGRDHPLAAGERLPRRAAHPSGHGLRGSARHRQPPHAGVPRHAGGRRHHLRNARARHRHQAPGATDPQPLRKGDRLMATRQKVVLAYSGGLDTSVLVRILTDEYGYDVIACHADVGESKDHEKLKAKARQAGAVAAEIVDAKEEFATQFCFPALQANALYQGVYPLSAALSRPLIAKHLVAAARKHGATAVAHGATGKGNEQVRFDLAVKGMAPDLKILAPQRERNITRDAAMECPASVALIAAHQELERFTVMGDGLRVKAQLDQRFAQLTYEGFWFSPLRLALQAFNDALAQTVTGEVTLKLYRGSMRVVGRSSPHGLYNHALSTYGGEGRFDHRAAEGFIHILGLQLQEFSRQHGGIDR